MSAGLAFIVTQFLAVLSYLMSKSSANAGVAKPTIKAAAIRYFFMGCLLEAVAPPTPFKSVAASTEMHVFGISA